MSTLGRVALAEALVLVVLAAWLWLRPHSELTAPAVADPTSAARSSDPTGSADIATVAGDQTAPVAPAPPADAQAPEAHDVLLFGRIRSAGGTPVTEGWLHATGAGETEPRRGQIGPNGDLALAGLAPGTWQVSAGAVGYRSLQQAVTVTPRPAEQRLDLVLTPAVTLRVWFVTPAGGRLAAALRAAGLDWRVDVAAYASTTAPAGTLMAARSRQLRDRGVGGWTGAEFHRRGQDAPATEPDGTLELDGAPPVWVSAVLGPCVLATQRVEPTQTDVRFVLDVDAVRAQLAGLRLRFTDAATGAPLVGVAVDLGDVQGSAGAPSSGADGVLERTGLVPGLVAVRTSAPEREDLRFWCRVAPGVTTDLGTFALGKALLLAGVVVGPDDQPLPARISWLDLDRAPFPQAVESNYTTSADGDGRFQLHRLGRSRYMVVANARDLAPAAALVDLRVGEPAPLRLQLGRGTRVTLDKQLAADDEFEALIKDGAGRMPWSGSLVQRNATSLLLAPGAYTLELHDAGSLRRSVPFVVGATPITVRVER